MSTVTNNTTDDAQQAHPRLVALVSRAREHARSGVLPRIGLVYAGDALALAAAAQIQDAAIAHPVLLGPRTVLADAAKAAGVPLDRFEVVETAAEPSAAAVRACVMARESTLQALMKGSLHTDALMSAVVNRDGGLRTQRRISHAFLFDLPRYPKLLALADCVVNIAPDLRTKRDIVGNAVELLQRLGIARPKVGIVAAVETVNPAIPATLDAQALVELAAQGTWPGAIVEGPFGFDNAISRAAARIKKIDGQVPGDADLLIMPDLNSGNMLYKSFNYIGGGDCAGLVLGAQVPVVITSRADSLLSRLASVALAVLASGPNSTSSA